MSLFVSACIVVSLSAILAQGQITSIYTSTKTSACRTIESSAEGTGSYVGECKAPAGYKVQLVEGDIRQTLNVITPARKKFELNFWAFYSSFSSIGEKIEWRMKGGVPVALIARYNVSNPEDSQKSVSYLMVAKIGKNENCVTDVIKPSSKQNEQAREAADRVAAAPCRDTTT